MGADGTTNRSNHSDAVELAIALADGDRTLVVTETRLVIARAGGAEMLSAIPIADIDSITADPAGGAARRVTIGAPGGPLTVIVADAGEVAALTAALARVSSGSVREGSPEARRAS